MLLQINFCCLTAVIYTLRPTSFLHSTSGWQAAFFQMVTWGSRFDLFVTSPLSGTHCYMLPDRWRQMKRKQKRRLQVESHICFLCLSLEVKKVTPAHIPLVKTMTWPFLGARETEKSRTWFSGHVPAIALEQILVYSWPSLLQRLKRVFENMFNINFRPLTKSSCYSLQYSNSTLIAKILYNYFRILFSHKISLLLCHVLNFHISDF